MVDIFFGKMVAERTDFGELRDAVIPLPESEPDGYRRVLLLGTTGAGKTTLVRQLIGTNPAKEERFPSTSTAKTTVHDTEIVLAEGNWRAVVTFASRAEVREHLNECISAAVLAAANKADDTEVLRRLLSHVNQRFRFNYVLGNGPAVAPPNSDFDDDEDGLEEETELLSDGENGCIDLADTAETLGKTVEKLRQLASRLAEQLRVDLKVCTEDDERVAEELFEEALDDLLRDDEGFHQTGDSLMKEIEKRFDLLPAGEVRKTRQSWPLTWSGEWPFEKRTEFLRAVSRFSSNYAPFFGALLTPLVNGLRVAGPFKPAWNRGEVPKLVLLDGEGLGHTPESSSAVSTAVSRRIEAADAVLLVDNATQPMQAAPLAAMREVVATGNAQKLIMTFTHFDEVKGDNLPRVADKVQHVLASVENVLAAFGENLGPYAERALRRRLKTARFFLAGIHEPLNDTKVAGRQTISQLNKLLGAVDAVIERLEPAEARPVYDHMNLVLAIRAAADAFHEAWRPRLGLEVRPGFAKEHWTRVKALSRRLAEGWDNFGYDTLQPVADLRKELRDRIYVFLQNPLSWEGPEPEEDQKQATFDAFAASLSRRLTEVCIRRLSQEHETQWQNAYDERGVGSTFVRARIIGDGIYKPAAPIPDVTPSPDRNLFLHQVVAEVKKAAKETGSKLA